MSFDFGNANPAQQEAIKAVEGPVLITAGPGTGKTATLVKRALYMIQEKGIKPEEIMMATFTEKAARELITRISNELAEKNIPVNLNEMYVGTFHSICLRFIKEHLEFTSIKKNYRVLDSFEQEYLVYKHIWDFHKLPDFKLAVNKSNWWDESKEICKIVNSLIEEQIDYELIISDSDPGMSALGFVLKKYKDLLSSDNCLDFASIQSEAYKMLTTYGDVLEEIQSQIKYLMIDEYQDTNYIQEQLVFLLAGSKKNICVVGDDDQGLYRFRGATIRNILEFPDKFEEGECKVVKLITNYRSNSDIVDFYNNWMQTTGSRDFAFSWGRFRYNKTIEPYFKSTLSSPAVIKVSAEQDMEEWCEENLKFIRMLVDSGKITNLNQIAFLFRSLGDNTTASPRVLAHYMEEHGINVYSPRSGMFFDREEVRLFIGALLLCFPRFVERIENNDIGYNGDHLCEFYRDCIIQTNKYLITEEGKPLLSFLRRTGIDHYNLNGNTDYAFSGLAYRMFEYEPFRSILSTDISSGLIDLRPTRNLSEIVSLLTKFEFVENISVFSSSARPKAGAREINKATETLFTKYLRYLKNDGIGEYEDDSEYAPSGCVSFLTIHQSKGMEFPVVIVALPGRGPTDNRNHVMEEVEERFSNREAFEPLEEIKYFDFWRLYYTAFSRAQNLLVISANEKPESSKNYFREVYRPLISYRDSRFNINEFDFAEVKDVSIKETYSFTSHIAVYEECALQYKFFKELGFTPVRVGATIFGSLVHQTIEDIHRSVLKGEAEQINPDTIRSWLSANYATISKKEHGSLGPAQIESAYNQVLKYYERSSETWDRIKEAEVEVGVVKDDYILKGQIDLIRGDGDTIEIVDFKSEKKPDLVNDYERIDCYRRQLQIYAHLIEEKTGQKVSKLHLYYTGEDSGIPTISFSIDKHAIEATIAEFDKTVRKIQAKDFSCKSTHQKTCDNCDFRFYCSK